MRGVRKAFRGTVAVDGVDLDVAAGEVCALVGQNGAGKSTLMGILSGAIRPDEGSMSLNGHDYAPRAPLDARQAGVAMIYQELSLAPHLSVAENIMLGMEPSRFGVLQWADMRATARRVLLQLGHSDIDPDRVVGTLSVAEQQLVEIGRALAVGCRVLVLDEPTSSLGRSDVVKLFELVRDLKARGHAIIYISHFIEEVKEIADRVVVLRDGRVVGSGRAAEMAADEIVRLMVGGSVEALFPRSKRVRGDAVLEVSGFGDRGVSFTLHRGEILGIAGLIGAGRTRLMRALFGLEPVRSGRVRLGVYSAAAPPRDPWNQGMGMVSEDRKGEGLALGLGVGDNLTLSRLKGLGPRGMILPSRSDAVTNSWMQRVGIRARGPRQPVVELSGGNQQKVAIARLLYHDVDVLLLDEPTRGVDVGSKAQIYTLIDAVVADGRAVLLVSSYLPELLGLCDRIAVMHRGCLGPARAASDWDEHSLMMAATGAGEAA
jgi:ribose transport system ATP-binding protein